MSEIEITGMDGNALAVGTDAVNSLSPNVKASKSAAVRRRASSNWAKLCSKISKIVKSIRQSYSWSAPSLHTYPKRPPQLPWRQRSAGSPRDRQRGHHQLEPGAAY